MICPICRKVFFIETDFFNLFQFDLLCIECKKIMMIPSMEIRIPTTSGYIDQFIMCPGVLLSPEVQFALTQKYSIGLKQAITSKPRYELILYLEDFELSRFEEWYPLLKKYPRILFLSMIETSLESFVMIT